MSEMTKPLTKKQVSKLRTFIKKELPGRSIYFVWEESGEELGVYKAGPGSLNLLSTIYFILDTAGFSGPSIDRVCRKLKKVAKLIAKDMAKDLDLNSGDETK